MRPAIPPPASDVACVSVVRLAAPRIWWLASAYRAEPMVGSGQTVRADEARLEERS